MKGACGASLTGITGNCAGRVSGLSAMTAPVGFGNGTMRIAHYREAGTGSLAVDSVHESARGVDALLLLSKEERPYPAAAVALVIRYLFGRFSRRDNFLARRRFSFVVSLPARMCAHLMISWVYAG